MKKEPRSITSASADTSSKHGNTRTMVKADVKNGSRLPDLIHYRIRVLTQDGRVYIGELMAFDKHMNMVLCDCVEERIPKTQIGKLHEQKKDAAVKIDRRTLGLTILRGEHVLTTVVEDKPAMTKKERLNGVKKQEKQLQKQKNHKKANKQKTDPKSNNRVTKPTANARTPDDIPRRKFQPPPGFKRR